MTTTVLAGNLPTNMLPGSSGALQRAMDRTGRFPQLAMVIQPLAGGSQLGSVLNFGSYAINSFLSYSFSSSVLVPVDSFNFTFAMPSGPSLNDLINEGDIVTITANDVPIGTGIIDQTQVDVDSSETGERGTLSGRDLMGQLEDQDAVSFDAKTTWADATTLIGGVSLLCSDTRINLANIITVGDVPQNSNLLIATEPGESKLAALQRFLEPLGCVAWMSPAGKLQVGKPNMSQDPKGQLVCSKAQRYSNVISMRVTRSATSIPNIIVPIWTGQEDTVFRVPPEQALVNSAQGPNRLLKLGHRVPKSVVISNPDGADAQALSQVNQFVVAAGGGNVLQAYAKREIARKNVNEIIVQAVVPGHFDENGNPYMIDSVYHVTFDRGNVDENMYLYQCEYQLTPEGGQRTNLFFCRLGSIVPDNTAPGGPLSTLSSLASASPLSGIVGI